MKKVTQALATVFYVGHIRVIPATFGAAFAAVLFWLVMPESPTVQAIATAAAIAVAIAVGGRAEKIYGHDGREIVIDEFAGMFLSLLALPKTPLVFVTAFLFFRVFDVLKPFPANRLQRLPGGWGVTMDDVFAAIYANLAVRVILWIGLGGLIEG